MISTDKAVNPTSVMGASKRVAELVVQAQAVGSGTSFSLVRFGNVLASNGSVVPRFLDQIKKGGPVTITHPDMRRFFMLIPEAVQLVLHAASQAESGATYVLEMGEQVSVVDMARNLIRLSGFTPDEDIKIEFTGLRPGEKLYEELVAADEQAQPSAVPNILCVRSTHQPEPHLLSKIDTLERDALAGRTDLVIDAMKALIGTFGRQQPAMVEQDEAVAVGASPAVHIRNPDEQTCPRCQVGRAHRSRASTVPERIKRELSRKRLFRCGDCGWRGWLVPMSCGNDAPIDLLPALDLASLDAMTSSRHTASRQSFSPRNLE